jgi:alkylated DNA repair dioxygenase AlkB
MRRPGAELVRGFVSPDEREELVDWLATLHPLWEWRYSPLRPIPPGQTQRRLHRPVYWLGSWQFACLHYYTPPHGVEGRCVEAEPFPPILRALVDRIERLAEDRLPAAFVPKDWALNTCLVNFYGSRVEEGRAVDQARVGDHRDHEPGPVASISFGERALFQFTSKTGAVVEQVWLGDRDLQLFAGPVYKDRLFHRIQRVARERSQALGPPIPGFQTRRVNLTFRCVPPSAVTPFAALPAEARDDVRPLVTELAAASPHWARALAAEPRSPTP